MLNCVSSSPFKRYLCLLWFYCGNDDKFIYNGIVKFHYYSVQHRTRLY